MSVNWKSTERNEFPEPDQEVVVKYGSDIETAKFERGISEKEREKMKQGLLPDSIEHGWNLANGWVEYKRSNTYRGCDEHGNNKVPYCWIIHGNSVFGQYITEWAEMSEFD